MAFPPETAPPRIVQHAMVKVQFLARAIHCAQKAPTLTDGFLVWLEDVGYGSNIVSSC